jgi:hypothetical protein
VLVLLASTQVTIIFGLSDFVGLVGLLSWAVATIDSLTIKPIMASVIGIICLYLI